MLVEGVKAVNDAFERTTSLISSKRETIFKQIINAILVFIILLVFGCLDFATVRFHYEYMTDLSYWYQIITKTIASICGLNIGINFMYDLEIKKDEILALNKERYENLNKYKDNDFDYFVEQIYNVTMKIRNYIAEINMKIFKLNRRSKPSDRILYSDPNVTENEKLNNKYCVRRKELEVLKSDEYIQKNIASLPIKFKGINPTIFELEIDGTKEIQTTKVSGSVNVGRAKTSASVIAGIVGLSMLTASFSLEANKEQFENQVIAALHYTLKAVTDIGIVLWQIINGMLRTKGIISSQITVPYANRVKVLLEYYHWKELKGDPVPQYYLDLKKEQPEVVNEESKEEYIEITEEQLKKLQGE